MNKQWLFVLAAVAVVQGCASVDRRAIPVVDASAPASEQGSARVASRAVPASAAPQAPADAGVVVMVPESNEAPLTFAAPESAPFASPDSQSGWSQPAPAAPVTPQAPAYSAPSAPTGIPSAGALAEDEQLDGPVLALLTTAQQLQSGGDLDGAASSLERAQRIAPREPQVLYRLAQVRLGQGDLVQAEQLSRRALSYAAGRPALQAGLWDLIAQARERQGDVAGAAQARERARVNL
ncbi:tetratricopeptide repeat protein [Stutzerimonas azotifigens]|uniref:tetratricopeptide repeat protein n=1 Tax=Stutzerimonas azotifigens TaxID=291995 RepID=UPI0004274106|nr:tetratricopeptide repeat protein [Stutzerimonas azotifigens]